MQDSRYPALLLSVSQFGAVDGPKDRGFERCQKLLLKHRVAHVEAELIDV